MYRYYTTQRLLKLVLAMPQQNCEILKSILLPPVYNSMQNGCRTEQTCLTLSFSLSMLLISNSTYVSTQHSYKKISRQPTSRPPNYNACEQWFLRSVRPGETTARRVSLPWNAFTLFFFTVKRLDHVAFAGGNSMEKAFNLRLTTPIT